jgi:hypothetical protein
VEQVGRDNENLSVSLLAFLLRYGTHFNYDQHVVAIGRGGIVPKTAIPGAEPSQTHMGTRIFVEDADTLRSPPPYLFKFITAKYRTPVME